VVFDWVARGDELPFELHALNPTNSVTIMASRRALIAVHQSTPKQRVHASFSSAGLMPTSLVLTRAIEDR
jgi:hypothetical protein